MPEVSQEDLYAAAPFAVAVVLYFYGKRWTKVAVERIAKDHPKSTLAAAYPLDWAIDFTQLMFVILLPLAGLLLARPNEPWALVVAIFACVFLAIAILKMMTTDPIRYSRSRLATPVTWGGILLNLFVAVILALGLLKGQASTAPVASDTLSIIAVEHSVQDAANVYEVRLKVHGGGQSLWGRTIWLANTAHQAGVATQSRPVSFLQDPCRQDKPADEWVCAPVYIGNRDESSLEVDLYAMFIDDQARQDIANGWLENPTSGYFPIPKTADPADPCVFSRMTTHYSCA